MFVVKVDELSSARSKKLKPYKCFERVYGERKGENESPSKRVEMVQLLIFPSIFFNTVPGT